MLPKFLFQVKIIIFVKAVNIMEILNVHDFPSDSTEKSTQRTNDRLKVISALDGKINKTPFSVKMYFGSNMDLCPSQGQMTKPGPTQPEAKPRVG